MIRYVYGSQRDQYRCLANTTFRDRASQFRDRLKWDVHVDAQGYERDEYDAQDPLYVIWQNPEGRHGGACGSCQRMGPRW